jgi:oxazoline/thiazoline synthase
MPLPPQPLRLNSAITVLGSGTRSAWAFLSETEYLILDDQALAYVVPLLQRPITIDALIKATCPPLTQAVLTKTVEILYTANLITVNPQFDKRNSLAFWDIQSLPGPRRAIFIRASAPEFSRQLENLLAANHVSVSAEANLGVVVTSDYLSESEFLGTLSTPPVLLTKPVGTEIWIGPLLSPGSVCWDCLRYWLSLRRWPEALAGGASQTAFTNTSVAWLPSTLTLATGLVATAATLLSAAPSIEAAPHIRVFDMGTLEQTISVVLGRRDCRRCVPEPCPTPPEFLAFLCDNRTGILANTQASETAIGAVYLAHSSVLLPLPRPGVRDPAPPLSAGGKGNTQEQALSRCLMEGIERYSCVFVGDESLVHARVDEIDAISPPELLLFSDEQFAVRDEANKAPGTMHGVPSLFDPRQPIAWVTAEGLTADSRRYVPAGYAYLWYSFPSEPMYNFADTNGCAAAPTRSEAILRALLELIERDAVAIWWYNRLQRPGVDFAAWDDPEIHASLNLFHSQNRTLSVIDISHDLGVPVYAAVSMNANGGEIYYGSAADTSAATAIKRAIAELIQFWFWDQQTGPPVDRELWLARSSLSDQSHMRPHGLAAIPQPHNLQLNEQLSQCVAGLRGAGLEAFAVDLTRPEIGIPVVRAVAPGLQHYGPRFGGKRLYEVPVKLGWLDGPLSASQMNPDAVVF